MKIKLLACALTVVATVGMPATAQAGVEDTATQVLCEVPLPDLGGYPWRCEE